MMKQNYTLMMKTTSKVVASIFILLIIPGCISNLFKEPRPTFSTEIIVPDLKAPFIKLTDNVYPAWKNKETGNVISIISDCTEGQYTLRTVHTLMSDSLDLAKIQEEKSTEIKKQPSYFRKIRGNVDDIVVEIQSYSLKNKNCLFVVSLSGKPEKIEKNKKEFTEFVNSLDFKR